MVRGEDLPTGWGLLELRRGRIEMTRAFREEPAQRQRLSLRNESAAGQPAPRRGPRGAAKHHRLPEVEETAWRNTIAEVFPKDWLLPEEEANVFLESDLIS